MLIILSIITLLEWIFLQKILGASNADIIKNPINLILILVNIIIIFNNKKIILNLKNSFNLKIIFTIEILVIIILLVLIYLNK